jgi:hypothetical protein
MRGYVHQFLAVKLLAVTSFAALLAGGAALGADGINLTITNDGTEDVYVSIYDAKTKAPIIEHQRLNGFSSLPVSANPDSHGLADITWRAISVDNRERLCGRGKLSGLDNDAVVNVHADSSC